MPRSTVPTLRHERKLLRDGHVLVAGMDEVGRGALAGPVTVGVVVVSLAVRTAPSGLRDSKLLTPAAREALVPRLQRWATAWAVGHAEAAEIDRHGIIAALRLAGRRALAALPEMPTGVLLDGSHDWLSPPRRRGVSAAPPGPDAASAPALFDLDAPGQSGHADPGPVVRTLVKADLQCAAVAAASVLAKVERDAIMVRLAGQYPAYGWADNKGYSAPGHLAALAVDGPCDLHRRSWNLPGVAGDAEGARIDLLDAVLDPSGEAPAAVPQGR